MRLSICALAVLWVVSAANASDLSGDATLRPDSSGKGFHGLLAAGTPVDVLVSRDGWAQISVKGWIPDDAWTVADGRTSSTKETRLFASAGAEESLGLLAPGTPLELLERGDGWTRVEILGWVEAATIGGGAAAAATATAGTTGGGAAVTGLIKVKISGTRRVRGSGARAWLVPEGVEIQGPEKAETTARLAELERELAELKDENREAYWEDGLYDSAAGRAKIDGKRKRLLSERGDILAARHGRHQAAASAASVAATVADDKGFFEIQGVTPGAYTLYVRFTRKELDLEWIEPVETQNGAVQLTLSEEGAQGLLPKASR